MVARPTTVFGFGPLAESVYTHVMYVIFGQNCNLFIEMQLCNCCGRLSLGLHPYSCLRRKHFCSLWKSASLFNISLFNRLKVLGCPLFCLCFAIILFNSLFLCLFDLLQLLLSISHSFFCSNWPKSERIPSPTRAVNCFYRSM